MKIRQFLNNLRTKPINRRRRSAVTRQRDAVNRIAEVFEERTLLAGNVLVAVGVDDLTQRSVVKVTGDGEANEITFDFQSDRLIIRGLSNTTINGSADPAVMNASNGRVPAGVTVDLMGGSDQIHIGDGLTFADAVRIQLGGGNDVAEIVGTSSPELMVSSGPGNDTIALSNVTVDRAGTSFSTAGTLSIHTGAGDDSVQLGQSTISDDLRVFTGAGDDTVGLGTTTVGKDTTVSGWYGRDQVLITGSTLDGNLDIRGRSDQVAPLSNLLTDDERLMDLDGNGTVERATDGELWIRHLAGFTDSGLTDGAVGAGASRTTAADIGNYIRFVQQVTNAGNPASLMGDGLRAIQHLENMDAAAPVDSQANTIQIENTTVKGNATVETRHGKDAVSLDGSTFDNDIDTRLGGADDAILVRTTEARDNFDAQLGDGDDFLLLSDAMLKDVGEFEAGNGADVVAVKGNSVFDQIQNFGGGNNSDAFAADTTVTFGSGRRVSGFESNTVSDATLNALTSTVQQRNDALQTQFAPTVNADAVTVTQRSQSSPLLNLLDNDTGHGLQVKSAIVESDKGATVILAADGRFLFDPGSSGDLLDADWGDTVADRFQYTAVNAIGKEFTADVNVTYVAPRAADYAYESDEDSVLNVSLATGVLQTNRDANESPLPAITAFEATSANGASVNVNADGSFSYDPTAVGTFQELQIGETLSDSFSYTLEGGHVGQVVVIVSGKIDSPDDLITWTLPNDDTQNTLTVGVADSVLGNDVGSGLTVTSFDSASANGVPVSVAADGSFTYSLSERSTQFAYADAGEFAGYDTFQYTNSAGARHSVVIAVTGRNDAPIAEDDEFSIPSDAVFNSTVSLFTNDRDYDDDTITIDTFDSMTAFGADVTVNPDGTFSYDMTTSGITLSRGELFLDGFNYTISDGTGKTADGAVFITITGINHDVFTTQDLFEIGENELLAIDAIPGTKGLLANDDDDDTTDSIFVSDFSATSTYGALVAVNRDGSFTYSPDASNAINALKLGQVLTDEFIYEASDGHGSTKQQSVKVTVVGQLDPGEDDYLLGANGGDITQQPVLNIPASIGLLSNDELQNATTTARQFTSPYGATVNVAADGSFTYDPANLDTQKINNDVVNSEIPDTVFDQFEYTATDGNGGSVTHTATVRLDLANASAVISAGTNPVTAAIANRELVITATSSHPSTQALHISLIGASNIFVSANMREGVGPDFAQNVLTSNLKEIYTPLGPFDPADFDKVIFNGSEGDDVFRVDALTALGDRPIEAHGNAGNDWISGGNAADQIRGGAGNDILRGLNGNDGLFGEAGEDQAAGDLGDDEVNGGEEGLRDLLIGGGGDNIATVEMADLNFDADRTAASGFLNAPAPPNSGAPVHAGTTTLFDGPLLPKAGGDGTYSVVSNSNNGSSSLWLTGQNGSTIDGHPGNTWVVTDTAHAGRVQANSVIDIVYYVPNVSFHSGPTKEVGFALHVDGSWHRFYIGSNIRRHNEAKRPLGSIVFDRWQKAQVNTSALGLRPGQVIRKIAIEIVGGHTYVDRLVLRAGGNTSSHYSGRTNPASVTLNANPSDADLNKSGKLTAYRNSDGSKVTLAGPSGYGFTFSGTPGTFSNENGSTEHFVARGLFHLETKVGKIPIPATSINPFRIHTYGDSHRNKGVVHAVEMSMFGLSSRQQSDPLFDFFNKSMGLSLGGIQQAWGIKLGKDLGFLELPLANAIPYIYFRGNIGNDIGKFGDNALNASSGKKISIAFDPADPMVAIKGGGIPGPVSDLAVGFSAGGRIPFKPTRKILKDAHGSRYGNSDPLFFGHLYGEGKVVVNKFQLSLEGLVVLDLDKNNDGNPLGLTGNELSRLMFGQSNLERVVSNALSDIQIGFNGKLNAEIGLGKNNGFGVTIPLGEATAFFNGDVLSISAGSVDPFKGTFLAEMPFRGGTNIDGDFFIQNNGDFIARLSMSQTAIGGIDLASLKIHISKRGSFVDARLDASARVPAFGGTASLSGRANSNGQWTVNVKFTKSLSVLGQSLKGSVHFAVNNQFHSQFGANLINFHLHWDIRVRSFVLDADFKGTLNIYVLDFKKTNGSGSVWVDWVGPGSATLHWRVQQEGNDFVIRIDLPSPVPDVNIRL